MPLPQIGGMTGGHGPWPACLDMEGTACRSLIESYASDVIGNIVIITPEMVDELANDFDMHRVRIYVDEDGIVTEIPVRGR